MSMIECPECGKRISDKASFCPGCGCPASEFSRSEVMEENGECPFCGKELVIDDGYCAACGMKINLKHKEEKYSKNSKNTFTQEPFDPYTVCPECHGYNTTGIFTCVHCGHKYKVAEYKVIVPREESFVDDFESTLNTFAKKIDSSMKHCPKCHSTSISYQDKISYGRAAVGGLLAGGTGAILGGLTGKKGYAVCLNCGKRWKV